MFKYKLYSLPNHGYEPQSKLWKLYRSKLRDIIPSATRIIRPANFSALRFWSLGLITTYQFRSAAHTELEFHNKKKTPVQLVIMLLGSIILVINLSGCGAFYQNYIDRTMDPYEEEVKALATKGEINAILLPGCATLPGAQDTLFSCLKLSRDVNPASVKLPPGEKLYLGHVSEFILRALKYYQLEGSFKDFYGCRIVLKFRKLTPLELRSRTFTDYSSFAVGMTTTVAGMVTMMPLGAVLFLVDGVKTEIDRQDFKEYAEMKGLPTPKKNMVYHQLESGGRTLLYVKDRIEYEVTGNSSERIQFDDKVTSYMVEECVLEKVTPEEMSIYQEQIKLFKNNEGNIRIIQKDN